MDENIVYSKEVIEFTAVATEFCRYLEEAQDYEGKAMLMMLQKLLPLLYLKSLYLPDIETKLDESLEKFVREEDWQSLKDILTQKFGAANDYVDVDRGQTGTEDLVYENLAENLSDIYQDIKDFLMAYRIGTVEIMNDAIWECNETFRLYWGQKLVSAISAVHYALINPDEYDIGFPFDNEQQDKSDWIISKRQDEYREENEDDL